MDREAICRPVDAYGVTEMPNIVIRLGALFALLSYGFTAALPAAPAAPFEPASCMFELPAGFVDGQDVTCGYLTVPSNHDQPDGPSLRLGVAVFKHRGEEAQAQPLFILQGGPGGSTLDTYPGLIETGSLLDHFDIVLLEQRGTTYSQPSLVCDETNQFVLDNLNTDLSSAEYNKLWEQALAKCHERLVSQGINLSDFDSVQNARDVEALRLALGYEKINLYGVSYGTLLALHYLRLFPQGLHAVVLDGVVPPQLNYIYTNVLDQDRVFKTLFAACRASPECSRSYPDLESVFFQVVDELEKSPAHVVLHDQKSGKAYDALIDGEGFYSGIYQTFYSSEFIPAIPRIIYKAREGDFEGFTELLAFMTLDQSVSYGMYYSVNCAEEVNNPHPALDLSKVYPKILEFDQGDSESFERTCQTWRVEALPSSENEAVTSDVPVLLLSGGFDPVTPESNAAAAAATLSHSYSYTIPSGGHGQAFSNACADTIILSFLQEPSTAPDSACIADYAQVKFWAPRDVVPVPLFGRVLSLERDLLSPLILLVIFGLGLASALLVLPLVWFVKLFFPKPAAAVAPGSEADSVFAPLFGAQLVLRFAGLAAMLNGLVVPVFWGVLTVFFFTMSVERDMMVLWGVPAVLRPLFLLPLLSIGLTILMLVETVLGWGSASWSVWRKLYYSILTICALACVGISIYLDVILPLVR